MFSLNMPLISSSKVENVTYFMSDEATNETYIFCNSRVK